MPPTQVLPSSPLLPPEQDAAASFLQPHCVLPLDSADGQPPSSPTPAPFMAADTRIASVAKPPLLPPTAAAAAAAAAAAVAISLDGVIASPQHPVATSAGLGLANLLPALTAAGASVPAPPRPSPPSPASSTAAGQSPQPTVPPSTPVDSPAAAAAAAVASRSPLTSTGAGYTAADLQQHLQQALGSDMDGDQLMPEASAARAPSGAGRDSLAYAADAAAADSKTSQHASAQQDDTRNHPHLQHPQHHRHPPAASNSASALPTHRGHRRLREALDPATGQHPSRARYQLLRLLGEGAVAKVWLSYDRVSRQHVALKIVEEQRHWEAAQGEYALARNLQHPHLVKSLRCVRTPHKVVMALEYADQGELFNRIVRGVGVPEALARSVLADVLDALEHIHTIGIVHRDVKPENILLDSQRGALLCDFGSVEVAGAYVRCGPGTMPYLPPEAISRSNTYLVDTSFDMWSLGVCLFVLLAGDFLWLAPQMSDVDFAAFAQGQRRHPAWNNFAAPLRELLDALLSLDPRKRPTPSQVRAYLDQPWFTPAASRQREAAFARQSPPASGVPQVLENVPTDYARQTAAPPAGAKSRQPVAAVAAVVPHNSDMVVPVCSTSPSVSPGQIHLGVVANPVSLSPIAVAVPGSRQHLAPHNHHNQHHHHHQNSVGRSSHPRRVRECRVPRVLRTRSASASVAAF